RRLPGTVPDHDDADLRGGLPLQQLRLRLRDRLDAVHARRGAQRTQRAAQQQDQGGMMTTTLTPAPDAAPAAAQPAKRKRKNSGSTGVREATPLTYIGLSLTVLLSVFPLWWMFVVASRDSAAASARPPYMWPGGNFLENLERLFANTSANFTLGLINSAVSATVLALSVVLFSSLAGFSLAKLKFRGRNAAAVGVVLTMAVPVQMGIIPLLMLMEWFGWRGQLTAIIVPFM